MFILINQAYGNRLTSAQSLLKNWNKVEKSQPLKELKLEKQTDEKPHPFLKALNSYKTPQKYFKPQQVYYAKDIMAKNVYSVKENTLLASVLVDFIQKDYSHIPIVDEDSQILGLVSDRDIHTWNNRIWTENMNNGLKEFEVVSCLKKEIICAREDTSIRMVATVMLEKKIGCLPIVDDDARVLGIITRSDILKAIVKYAPLETWL
ncbi:CBS domain-containing protein [Fibrobacterales bacterium]|nr:CBS domain-containing protein [Fibrobacterales bacterium]